MRKRTKALLIAGIGAAAVILGVSGVMAYRLVKSGLTRPFDNMFGDQHLKTVVALVELHKLRFGLYPESLSDLRYAGEWDRLALASVAYCTNADGTAYFVEVTRGWVGRPQLTMPHDFWRGTGFDPGLGPCD